MPLAFESAFNSYETLYASIVLGVVFTAVAVGVSIFMMGARKQAREIAAGYTVNGLVADGRSWLVCRDAKTLAIISEPPVQPTSTQLSWPQD
ncbi:hypothetical protein SAMN05892883_2492 [Jatrophihabitans sp. GAS493]|uniref:hypothetical protein n=1 Tax=Jatrophihabitans sp. GAS493 TaxID=1907575 RepID=UPI000BB765F3|nr:hypothetical protein [Jatrophihabitans sp. GAS493]SOD73201.1 hypothetical protein SAMN05892883_2492 [Jatrophihabitans sp. GAS493]